MQSLCQCLDDVVTNTVVVGLGDSEVLLTVIPDSTADAMLMEYLIDVTNPAQCILRIGLVWFLGNVLGLGIYGYWYGAVIASYGYGLVVFPYFFSDWWITHFEPVV